MNFKNYILAIIICFSSLASCSDDENTNDNKNVPQKELIDIQFKVKDYFTTEITDFNSTKSTLQEAGIKILQYRVIDRTSGRDVASKILHLKNYEITNNDDLIITDKLPKGNYWVFFIGSTNPDFAVPDLKVTDANYFEKARLVYLPDYKTQLFSSSLWLDLYTDLEKIEKDITLERNVGKIEIVIQDAQKMPANINYLYPAVKTFYPNVFRFADWVPGKPLGFQSWGTLYPPHLNEQNQPNIEMKPTGFKVGNVARSEVIKNSSYTMTLYMLDNQIGSVYNGQDYLAGGIAYTRIFIYGTVDEVTASPMGDSTFPYIFEYKLVSTGVNVIRNKITRISGNIFEGVTGGDNASLKVTVNDEWDGLVDEPYK